MSANAPTIIQLNIERYRTLLKTEIDPTKQKTISQLLAEEEIKLSKEKATAARLGRHSGPQGNDLI